MSEPAVRAELQITLKDGSTAGLKAIAAEAEKTAKKISSASEEAAKKSTSETEKSTSRQRSSYERLSHAREVLGVRSERSIQREIQQTEAAYKRLESSGTVSSEALARAAEKTREKITRLTNEMGKLTAEQKRAAQEAEKFEKINTRIRTGIAVGAGVAAAGYTLSGPARAAMSFDERLASMSNTAYAERDAAGRVIGMRELEAVINKAVRPGIGGGTREQAAEALDAMIAKNTLGYQRSIEFLPTVMKTASGASADPTQIANLASVLVGQKVVSNDAELKTALNMVTAAGQAGGFEIKDMARWLSQQMPLAGKAGLMGLDGLQKVLAMNQAAVLTAGTTDEAGNNVKNLLAKLASRDTATDFEKAGRGDLTAYMMNQRLKGVDAVSAWQNIIDSEAEKDPRLQAAIAKLNQTKDKGEQARILESIKALSEGGVIGKYFQDMQAVGALMGLRNKDVVGNVEAAISRNRKEFGVNDVNYEVMSGTSSFQVRAASQAKEAAQKSAMDGLTPAIGRAAEMFTDIANKHPVLIGATTLATAALGALATAAGLSSMALGGKGNAIARTAAKYMPTVGKTARAGGIGVGALVGGYALDKAFGEESAISRYGSSMLNGAAIGATVGSFVPVLGTGIGAAVGGGIGALYEGIKDALKPAEQKPVDVDAKLTVGLAPGLVLQSQSVQTSGQGNVQMNTGSLWSTP
ncbi:phage tail tape measure protein [Candidatus Ferrigenium straubiae]|jgi:hypothetical protein|uniref:phage tail tape measure protein n=1 Tax=Candidatus Ferrigenium straubiae TaxID=2919506 RepID=UPI003F4A91D4